MLFFLRPIILFSIFSNLYSCLPILEPQPLGRTGDRLLRLFSCYYFSYKFNVGVSLPKDYLPESLFNPLKTSIEATPPFLSQIDKENNYWNNLTDQAMEEFKDQIRLTSSLSLKKLHQNQRIKLWTHFENSIDEYANFLPEFFSALDCPCSKKIAMKFPGLASVMISTPTSYENGFILKPDWQDSNFKKYIHEKLKSFLSSTKETDLPENSFNIAIHFRQGGDFDPPLAKLRHTVKFLPLSFYTDNLPKILEYIPKEVPIFIGIFTDCNDPSLTTAFIQTISDVCDNRAKVKLLSREEDLFHDIVTMSKFDFIMRPISSFSIVSEHLGDFAGVCTTQGQEENSSSGLDVLIHFDQDKFQKRINDLL